MTTYSFPTVTPQTIEPELIRNVAVFRSPFTDTVKTRRRNAGLLGFTLNFENLAPADRNELIGFLALIDGPKHRFTLSYFGENQQGNFGGTPLVAGANQLGNTLNIDGCSNNITDWIKRGDVVGVNGELKIAALDSDTNGSGAATLTFWPRLRSSPADNAAITVSNPTGIFMLIDERQGWAEEPAANGPLTKGLTIRCVEDPLA